MVLDPPHPLSVSSCRIHIALRNLILLAAMTTTHFHLFPLFTASSAVIDLLFFLLLLLWMASLNSEYVLMMHTVWHCLIYSHVHILHILPLWIVYVCSCHLYCFLFCVFYSESLWVIVNQSTGPTCIYLGFMFLCFISLLWMFVSLLIMTYEMFCCSFFWRLSGPKHCSAL